MPDPWYPAAVRRPGRNAGYASGHATMDSVVCHYTVGRDSTGIGDQGYFTWLVRRDGQIIQFAEADAVTWHAGNWNQRGPGIEVEYLDEPTIFTPEAWAATAGLVQWLHDEWGIPIDFYDGPRTTNHHGFITHRSLIQTGDAHYDYWPALPAGQQVDLAAIAAYLEGATSMAILAREPGVSAWLVHEGRTIGINQAQWDTFAAKPGTYVFDGLSHDQLVGIVFPPAPAVGTLTVDEAAVARGVTAGIKAL